MTGSEESPGEIRPSDYTEVVTPTPRATESICNRCGSAMAAADAFCEACGGGTRRSTVEWLADVGPDRSYFDQMAAGIEFPTNAPTRTYRLDQDEITIGRRSATRGTDPAIDLSQAPEDPAVSHRHAVLLRAADGSFAVADLGSTNGTRLNGASTRLKVGRAVPLADGDRIHIGAWTSITLREDVHRTGFPRSSTDVAG